MVEPSRTVSWSVKDGIATVRLAGRHGNAINDDLVAGLMTTLQEVEAEREVRGVLLASERKLFSPGLDLLELSAYDRASMARFLSRFHACLLILFTFPRPVVAAIKGHAIAGGCILALTADWRILKDGAVMGLNEIKVGVPLPFGVSLLVRETVAAHKLCEIALLGANYSGQEAVAAGVAHEVVPEEGFDERVLERVKELASRDLQAYAITKRYLRSGTVERIRASDQLFQEEFLDRWFSEQTRGRMESIVADLKKRNR